jgi:NAD(P)-dependent dehydrogenase (short-subunit alcohol dehydrogenase family)
MSSNSYIAYLPTVPFGPGIKSGSEFRALWDRFTKVLLNPKSTYITGQTITVDGGYSIW